MAAMEAAFSSPPRVTLAGSMICFPIRANDFRLEPELTAKLAKRGAVIYEVPIRYAGRTYQEGKKIGVRDGLKAILAILRWKFLDDLYQDDEYGSAILTSLNNVHRFNRWMARFIQGQVGAKVLEIGAGIGNITRHLVPREKYRVTDINRNYLAFLRNWCIGKPYMEVMSLDLTDSEAFRPLEGSFDTVICLNVLEHIEDDRRGLENIFAALEPGGKAIMLVPQGQWLYSSLDHVLEHVKRYSRKELEERMKQAGFENLLLKEFNHFGVPGWLLNGIILKKKHFSRIQLKIYNMLTPLIQRIDPLFPWPGLSLVAIGEKPRHP